MNNDLISREALKKWVDDSVSQYGNQYSTDMLNMFGLFREIIDNAPTVEERPQDNIRWVEELFVKRNGDIIDSESRVVGHINFEEMKDDAELFGGEK